MKNKVVSIIAIMALAVATACSSKTPSPEEKMAADEGKAAGEEVVKAKPGSMNRENALLKIRATEEKILQTGDTAAARAYIHAAEAVIDSIL